MTTETFIDLRANFLRKFFRIWWGRRWRYIVAKRLGRRDAPRFLVARPGKHRVTLAQIIPVEKLAIAARRGHLELLGLRDPAPGSAWLQPKIAASVEADTKLQSGGTELPISPR
jgi:hypothetical protein